VLERSCVLLPHVATNGLLMDQAAPLDFDFRPFFLHRRREHLYRRIDARCEEMVQRGLLQVTLVMPVCFVALLTVRFWTRLTPERH